MTTTKQTQSPSLGALAVNDGAFCVGCVQRGPGGKWMAFDSIGAWIGAFATQAKAVAALSAAGKQTAKGR
jgi:hypothetical protein